MDSAKARLERTVAHLANGIGPRNLYHRTALERAASDIEAWLAATGCRTARQNYEARGARFENIIAELPGASSDPGVLVVGAHYDTHKDSPGANDNGSGIAALLELARAAAARRHA